ncbi:hypothetical protein ACIA8C_09870 [Nocardia sp. NPDC051321]|uniref:hypothetical protein n=1 Tax=Nocardia sp. NPDC051321 TaxID=3364323 RepID=UPI00379739AE
MAGYAAALLVAHQRRADLPSTSCRGVDAELTQLVRAIDATVAELVDIPHEDSEIGELVSRMAAGWLFYRAYAGADISIAAALRAQRDYDTAIEQLPMLRRSLR